MMYLENQEDLHKQRKEKRQQIKGRVQQFLTGEQTQTGRYDKTIEIDSATIQHGKNNNRIYLMDIGQADPEHLIRRLNEIAVAHHYEKIFAKIPAEHADVFRKAGYSVEASVKGLYAGERDGLFLGKFLHAERSEESLQRHYQMITSLARSKQPSQPSDLSSGVTMRMCTGKDASKMAKIYGKVFDSYPFPIDESSFIRRSMKEGTRFACIEVAGKMAALASAECSFASGLRYAEMTDFATLPEYRGNGFALNLLKFLEERIAKEGIITAYTIARAVSVGMNVTFAKGAYEYGGRLKNNTDIAGKIESMNVWFKQL
jgi:putative beta-lysine N-acetyltransferase